MTRLPFRDAREKGPGRGPRPLFSFSRMTGCLLDTRLADGISKVFQEPSGVGTIITNHTSNKARRVTSWQKRSKTNSTVFLRDNVLKKKKKIPRLTNGGCLQLTTPSFVDPARNQGNNILQLLCLNKQTQSSPPGLPKEKRDNQTLGKTEQLPFI